MVHIKREMYVEIQNISSIGVCVSLCVYVFDVFMYVRCPPLSLATLLLEEGFQ